MAVNLNGADYSFWNKDERNKNVPRSGFDLTFKHAFTMNEGEIRPFYEEYVLPNSELRTGNKFVIWQSPLSTRNFTNQRVYTHYFAQSVKHMWHAYRQQQFGGRYQDYDTPELHFNSCTVDVDVSHGANSSKDVLHLKYTEWSDAQQDFISLFFGFSKDAYDNYKPQLKMLSLWRSCSYEVGSLMDSFGFQTDVILPESVCPNPWLNWLYLSSYREFFMNKVLWRGDGSDPSSGMRKVWFPDDEEDFSFKVGSGNASTGQVGRFWSTSFRSGLDLIDVGKVSVSSDTGFSLLLRFHNYATGSTVTKYYYFGFNKPTPLNPLQIPVYFNPNVIFGENNASTVNAVTWFNALDDDKKSYVVKYFRNWILEQINVLDLFEIRYRNYRNDYFTSCLPSPLIGGNDSMPKIIIDSQAITASIDFTDSILPSDTSSVYSADAVYLGSGKSDSSSPTQLYGGDDSTSQPDFSASRSAKLLEALNRAKVNLSTPSSFGLTLDNIRMLNATTLYLEALARSDGDYSSFVRAIYGVTPSENDTKPFYLGGSATSVLTQDVVQNAPENSSADTILGSVTQRGSASNNSKIGKLFAKDSMIVIGVMSILPDTLYCQGVSRKWTARDKLDRPNPFFTGIQMQAVQNYELFVSGNESVDNDPFGYQGAFDFMRYRSNRVSGLIKPHYSNGVLQDKPFSQMTQVRYFDETPSLNMDFVSTKDNISHEHLAVTDISKTPEFSVIVSNEVSGILPLPYYAVPQKV